MAFRAHETRTDEWATPDDVFSKLDSEFHFDLDVAAADDNHKCSNYFTINDDGLSQSWGGHRCWCNPPYGRVIKEWVRKASESGSLVVMLLPARTDTAWFHDYVYGKAEIRFIRGRLRFGKSKANAPFPSMIVIFREETI